MLPLKFSTVFSCFTILALLISGFAGLSYGQVTTQTCEQCGMVLDATAQARFKILDDNGSLHVACCPICAIRLQRTLGDLNITSFCDYYGPSYPINIITKSNGTDVIVNPTNALIILGGSCTKNRLVYNSSAADALLAPPNNGTSKWLSPLTNDTVAANATRQGVAQSALINGIGLISATPSPSPSPSPTPSPSPSPTSSPTSIPQSSPSPTPSNTPTPTATSTPNTINTQTCEVCGMDVTPDSQARYKVTDGTGNIHFVECFMCALQLINNYETLHIETCCDWYGPNYPIIIDTSHYGAKITVSPSTAIYLRGGSCVTARAAYNQTAADNLLANGFSDFTSPEQRYALPPTTQVKLVNEAISTWYAQADTTNAPTSLTLALLVVVGFVIIGGSVIAYKTLISNKSTNLQKREKTE